MVMGLLIKLKRGRHRQKSTLESCVKILFGKRPARAHTDSLETILYQYQFSVFSLQDQHFCI